ncbi:hypothetical protein [Rhizobium nepotum]|uniref:hypothetical protein n=1 Tax=Rhizobium nepotum TaxID=1035271 RepID=UPI003CF84BB4
MSGFDEIETAVVIRYPYLWSSGRLPEVKQKVGKLPKPTLAHHARIGRKEWTNEF